MVTMTEIPVADLKRQAAQARPGRGIATWIAAVFVAIGWITGRTISGIVFCGLAMRYGYRLGRGTDPVTGKPPELAAVPEGRAA
jgi:hypothetical protein